LKFPKETTSNPENLYKNNTPASNTNYFQINTALQSESVASKKNDLSSSPKLNEKEGLKSQGWPNMKSAESIKSKTHT
jgi:hypothetical protein